MASFESSKISIAVNADYRGDIGVQQ